MKEYKVITLFNAIGVYEFNFNSFYKDALKWYEENKKDDLVMISIMVNEKGKVLHIFDNTKEFSYNKELDYFLRKDLFL